jgi:hypothetical protein
MQLIGFDFVVARDIETDDLVRLAVVDLNPVSPAPSSVLALPDLTEVDDRDWAEARRRLDLIAPLLDGTRSPRASSSSEPKPPAWMPRRSTGGPGRTARRGCSRRYFRINPAAVGARAGLMPGLRRSSNRRSVNTSSRGSSGRSGRRRSKCPAAAAKRSCVRRTQTRFGSGSRRFQHGNASAVGLTARPRSINLRRGPVCSTAHNDRSTSCKSVRTRRGCD